MAALNFVPHDKGGDLLKIRWHSMYEKAAIYVREGGDLRMRRRRSTYKKAAIYVREGGDLRTDKVTYWAPVGAKNLLCTNPITRF